MRSASGCLRRNLHGAVGRHKHALQYFLYRKPVTKYWVDDAVARRASSPLISSLRGSVSSPASHAAIDIAVMVGGVDVV